MSTTDSQEVRRLGEKVKERGAWPADCRVSGGCHRAATGNIAIFAGCERPVFERLLPTLSEIGHEILHTGELGWALVLKVVTNYLATAGDRTYKLGSGTTSEYGRYVKSRGEPRDGEISFTPDCKKFART
jgi:6-phosphogluconate dehydrogenase (decarboxylating)